MGYDGVVFVLVDSLSCLLENQMERKEEEEETHIKSCKIQKRHMPTFARNAMNEIVKCLDGINVFLVAIPCLVGKLCKIRIKRQ